MKRGLVLLVLLLTAVLAVGLVVLWPPAGGEGLVALRSLPISTYVPAGATVLREDQTQDRSAGLLDPMPTTASIVRVVRPDRGTTGRKVALSYVDAAQRGGWVLDETFEDAWTFQPRPWQGYEVTLSVTLGDGGENEMITVSVSAPVTASSGVE